MPPEQEPSAGAEGLHCAERCVETEMETRITSAKEYNLDIVQTPSCLMRGFSKSKFRAESDLYTSGKQRVTLCLELVRHLLELIVK